MRKIILSLFLGLVFFSSCKKDKKQDPVTPPSGKTYAVKFKIADYNKQTTSVTGTQINSLSTTDAPTIPSTVEQIFYYAIDSQGKTVSLIVQQKGAANFGAIADNLPAGTYTIKLYAGTKNLLDGTHYSLSLDYGGREPFPFWEDTFATSFSITVSDQPIDQSVSMQRIVGQITVKLLDIIPSNAYSLRVEVDNEMQYYPVTAQDEGYIMGETRTIPVAVKGTTNYAESYAILNTGSNENHKVTITCYDSDNKILAQTTVNDVIVQRNTNTILSGKIFGQTTGFDISLNQDWGTPINIGF